MAKIDIKAINITRNVIRLLRIGKDVSAETADEVLEALLIHENCTAEDIVGVVKLESENALLVNYNGRVDWLPKSAMHITERQDDVISFKLTEHFARLKGAI